MRRLIRLAKNILISNFTDLRYPYRFTYILTYRCNLKCNMCNIWKEHGEEELSVEQIKKFFKNFWRFSWINLSGGEIFLRKDLSEVFDIILTTCRDLYLLDFPTNGFQTELILEAITNLLTNYKIPKILVTVSLDGPRKLHDQVRGVEGSWDRAVETFRRLRKLRSARFNVFFGTTLQRSNMSKFHETVKSVEEKIGGIHYNDFHVNLIQYSPHYYRNIDTSAPNDRSELWAQLEEIMRKRKFSLFNPVGFLEYEYQRLAKFYLAEKKTPIVCQAFSASFFMDPKGNIFPCSIYNKAIGNIVDFDYDISRMWDTVSRYRVREEIRKGKCPQCWTPCEAYQSILANLFVIFKKVDYD